MQTGNSQLVRKCLTILLIFLFLSPCYKESAAQNADETSASLEKILSNIPHVFQGNGFTVGYFDDWREESIGSDSDDPIMKLGSPSLPAVLFLRKGQDHRSKGYNNLEDIVDAMWTLQIAENPEIEVQSRDNITIGGQTAIKVVYRMNSPDGYWYVIQAHFMLGNRVYTFTGNTPYNENLSKSLAEMDEISKV